jgi:peptide/nickel transport system ATP-binding protein/oligopeptide transport system ATP-binding protein
VADDKGHAVACHRIAELPSADGVASSNGGFSPTLEKLVAAFRLSREASSATGFDKFGDNLKSVSPSD